MRDMGFCRVAEAAYCPCHVTVARGRERGGVHVLLFIFPIITMLQTARGGGARVGMNESFLDYSLIIVR